VQKEGDRIAICHGRAHEVFMTVYKSSNHPMLAPQRQWPIASIVADRLIRIMLALGLLPIVLSVLLVGGATILALAVTKSFTHSLPSASLASQAFAGRRLRW
jgi:hypothetical protein